MAEQRKPTQRYLSGRTKVSSFAGLHTDRHLYVHPGEVEPSLGYPGEKSIPISNTYYRLVTIDGAGPYDRYWQAIPPATLVSGISIFDEGNLVGTANSISKIDFVGAAISATASGSISTVTVQVVSISTAAPAGSKHGDLWWDSDEGELNVYYNDGNSSQWVLANSGISSGPQGGGGSGTGANVTISSSPPSNPNDGDLWWDEDIGELFIYYDDASGIPSAQWVEASSGSNTVNISDSAPPSPNNGDLWWESDTGRLKVYYQDIDTTQWVDASPPLGTEASSLVEAGANGEISFGDAPSDLSSNTASNSIKLYCDKTANSNALISYNAHLRPTQNNAFDIGSAELKIRDLYQSNPSDIRLKKDVSDYSGGLDFINSLRVVDFTWKQEAEQKAGKRETGFIAQEIGNALALSNYNSWRLHSANPDSYQGVDHTQLIPALVSAIQELTARVAELENK